MKATQVATDAIQEYSRREKPRAAWRTQDPAVSGKTGVTATVLPYLLAYKPPLCGPCGRNEAFLGLIT
jgi:hypothetical protein